MFTKSFVKSAVERAVKTFAQAVAAAAALGDPGVSAFGLDWQGALGLGLAAALASVLSSVGSAPFGPDGSPSVVGE